MKKKIFTGIYILFLVVQTVLMLGMVYLQKLTHKKAGVNHHLYYRRAQFNNTILTPEVIQRLTVAFFVLIILVIFLLIKNRCKYGLFGKVSGVLLILWMGVTVSAFYLQVFRDLYIYPYLMAAFGVSVLLAGCNYGIGNYISRRQK